MEQQYSQCTPWCELTSLNNTFLAICPLCVQAHFICGRDLLHLGSRSTTPQIMLRPNALRVVRGQMYYTITPTSTLAAGCQESSFTLGPSIWDPQVKTAQAPVLYHAAMSAVLYKRPTENESLHWTQKSVEKLLTIKIKHLVVWSRDSLA